MPRERNDYYRAKLSFPHGSPKLYVIAAEGDKTEYKYFNTLKDVYSEQFRLSKLHVEYLERPEHESGQSDPAHVEQMIATFLENHKDYDFQEYDELWFIVDTDEYFNREESILRLAQKCRESSLLNLGLSNPCFEIWLILHFADINDSLKNYLPDSEVQSIKQYLESVAPKQRAGACKRLLPVFHQNQQPLYKVYIAKVIDAINHARQLGACDPCSEDFPATLCTSVYSLIENIMKDIGSVN